MIFKLLSCNESNGLRISQDPVQEIPRIATEIGSLPTSVAPVVSEAIRIRYVAAAHCSAGLLQTHYFTYLVSQNNHSKYLIILPYYVYYAMKVLLNANHRRALALASRY